MEDMANKTVDVADKMNEGAEKLKTIGKEDGCNGGHDGWGLRQICANSGGHRDKGLRNFLRKRAMCQWSKNKLLEMAENATMAAVFA